MKFCTLYEVTGGERGPAMNVMIVLDNHRFGRSEDGLFEHAEAGKLFLTPVAGDGRACVFCGATEDLVIHHTDANVLNDDPRAHQVVCREHIPHRDG